MSVVSFEFAALSSAGLVAQAFNDVHGAGDDFPAAALQFLMELSDPGPGRDFHLFFDWSYLQIILVTNVDQIGIETFCNIFKHFETS